MQGRLIQRLRQQWWQKRRLAAARRAIRTAPDADVLFVLGLSRSGSTWLQEALGKWPGTFSLFEPIHRLVPGTVTAASLEDMSPDGHLTVDERQVLTGIIRGELLAARCLPPGDFPKRPRRICIKLINCVNGVERMSAGLELRRPPVVIVRHPCAHIASWKRLNWTSLVAQSGQHLPWLLERVPALRAAVKDLSTPIERMAANWCLGNYAALHTDPRGSWKVVRYETLLTDPVNLLDDIFRFWGEADVPAEVLADIEKPSRTTWRKGEPANFRPDAWRDEVTPDEEAAVYATCARFNVRVDHESYHVA